LRKKIFYQSSLPRSGSTLLQNLLSQNPDFYCTPTSGVLELIYAARANYTTSPEFKAQDQNLMKEGFLNFCREGMYGFYDSITDKKYVLDKSRGWAIHYDFLNLVHPEPKIVCMVRDLRDIFASMEKNFRRNPEKSNDIVDWSKLQATTVPKRIDLWIQTPPIGIALDRIVELFRQGISKKVHFIKYEDLCLYPEIEINKLYNFFGLEYYFHDFDNIEQTTKEDDEIYGIYGDHKIRKQLEMYPSDADEILGKDVSNWIYDNYRWFFDEFKYVR
jgi:sulfotransferase